VIADVTTETLEDLGAACPECQSYLHRRAPERIPAPELLEEETRRYPEPVFASREEAIRAENEGTFGEAFAASWLTVAT
jgi:hypothetical protein